jgi:hypothetical protein
MVERCKPALIVGGETEAGNFISQCIRIAGSFLLYPAFGSGCYLPGDDKSLWAECGYGPGDAGRDSYVGVPQLTCCRVSTDLTQLNNNVH